MRSSDESTNSSARSFELVIDDEKRSRKKKQKNDEREHQQKVLQNNNCSGFLFRTQTLPKGSQDSCSQSSSKPADLKLKLEMLEFWTEHYKEASVRLKRKQKTLKKKLKVQKQKEKSLEAKLKVYQKGSTICKSECSQATQTITKEVARLLQELTETRSELEETRAERNHLRNQLQQKQREEEHNDSPGQRQLSLSKTSTQAIVLEEEAATTLEEENKRLQSLLAAATKNAEQMLEKRDKTISKLQRKLQKQHKKQEQKQTQQSSSSINSILEEKSNSTIDLTKETNAAKRKTKMDSGQATKGDKQWGSIMENSSSKDELMVITSPQGATQLLLQPHQIYQCRHLPLSTSPTKLKRVTTKAKDITNTPWNFAGTDELATTRASRPSSSTAKNIRTMSLRSFQPKLGKVRKRRIKSAVH